MRRYIVDLDDEQLEALRSGAGIAEASRPPPQFDQHVMDYRLGSWHAYLAAVGELSLYVTRRRHMYPGDFQLLADMSVFPWDDPYVHLLEVIGGRETIDEAVWWLKGRY